MKRSSIPFLLLGVLRPSNRDGYRACDFWLDFGSFFMVAHKNAHHYNFNDIKVHIKVNEIQAKCFILLLYFLGALLILVTRAR